MIAAILSPMAFHRVAPTVSAWFLRVATVATSERVLAAKAAIPSALQHRHAAQLMGHLYSLLVANLVATLRMDAVRVDGLTS